MPTAHRARAFTRREGLVALALAGPVAALAACTSSDTSSGQASSSEAAASSSGAATVAQAAVDEAALIARYEAAIEAVPSSAGDLRAALSEIRDQHRAHLSALGGAEDAAAPSAPTSTAAVIAELIEAERTASKERITACVDARDGEQARILSLIAASEASHVPALRDLRGLAAAAGSGA